MLENISFQMNLVSRLAVADCASGVAGNIDISEHTCKIIYHQQDQDKMDVLEVIFPKNGSLFFKNTSPYSRTQYFLSNEPSQPFGAAVCAPGNHLNFNIAKHSDTVISHNNYKIWL